MGHMSYIVASDGERDIYICTHEQDESVTRMRTDHLCYDVVDIDMRYEYNVYAHG